MKVLRQQAIVRDMSGEFVFSYYAPESCNRVLTDNIHTNVLLEMRSGRKRIIPFSAAIYICRTRAHILVLTADWY